MKYKVGIFGSAVSKDISLSKKVNELVSSLAKYNIALITGAGLGIPYQVAKEAFEKGMEIHGFAPAVDLKSYKALYKDQDTNIYKRLFFIPKSFKFVSNLGASKHYRNLISTATCDAGIIISGRWGAMNEFTNLYDMGKIIGVLTGTGGIADDLERLNKKIKKDTQAKVLFDSSPKLLVEEIMTHL